MKSLFVRRCSLLAFTLTEILVAIAIVVLLMALIVPSISKIKGKMDVSKCINNHRQITAAFLNYINDNNGMLWTRIKDAEWSNGSGGLYGPQSPWGAGYLCTILEDYGLERAKWDAYKPISNRQRTVWYCPTTYDKAQIAGHGATYYYRFLGNKIGATEPVPLASVSEYISNTYYLRDYFGSHERSDALYAWSGSEPRKLVFSYLDGHSEYRAPKPEDN